jgi:hypothetical protein
MDNQQVMTQFELGWLVCAIESEGCFSLRKQARCCSKNGRYQKSSFYPMVELTTTDMSYARNYRRLLDIAEIGHYDWEVVGTDKKRPQYRTKVRGLLRMDKLMMLIMPYLVSKVDRAATLMQFIKLRLSKGKTDPYTIVEIELFNKLRNLNGYRTLQNPRDYTRDILGYKLSGQGRRYSPNQPEKVGQNEERDGNFS